MLCAASAAGVCGADTDSGGLPDARHPGAARHHWRRADGAQKAGRHADQWFFIALCPVARGGAPCSLTTPAWEPSGGSACAQGTAAIMRQAGVFLWKVLPGMAVLRGEVLSAPPADRPPKAT